MTQSKPPKPPEKHHYIPEFYTKCWTTDGKLVVFQRASHGPVVHAQRSPAATGYLKRLYLIAGLPPEEAAVVETEFMQPLDGLAAKARDKMLSRLDLTPKERDAWTKFILSLLLRTPEEVAIYKESYFEQRQRYREKLAREYEERQGSDAGETYDEYIVRIGRSGVEQKMMRTLISLISNPRVTEIIKNMTWLVFNTSAASYDLMTSDRPAIIPHKLGSDEASIALPLGPRSLFVAFKSADVVAQLRRRGPSGVVADVNSAVVGHAVKFVYARDASQARFVENRISTQRQPSLMEQMLARF